MPSSQIERKLAAIMFTDIAGYTKSMSKSESKTLNLLEKKRSILKPLLKEYKGTFVKEIGDGTLSYFESAVNAATCAVKFQETTYDDKEMNRMIENHHLFEDTILLRRELISQKILSHHDDGAKYWEIHEIIKKVEAYRQWK